MTQPANSLSSTLTTRNAPSSQNSYTEQANLGQLRVAVHRSGCSLSSHCLDGGSAQSHRHWPRSFPNTRLAVCPEQSLGWSRFVTDPPVGPAHRRLDMER